MRHVFVGFVFHSTKLQDFLPYSSLSLSLSLSLYVYLSLVWEFQTHGAKIPRNSMPYRVVPVWIYIWQAQSMNIKVFIGFSFIKKPRDFTKQTYLKVYLKVHYLQVITLMPCYLIIPYYGLFLKQLDWITLHNNILDFHYCYVEVLRC